MPRAIEGPEYAAYHESGHCVVSCILGAEPRELWIKGRKQGNGNEIYWDDGNAGIQKPLDAISTIKVLSAGAMAEFKYHALSQFNAPLDFNEQLPGELVSELYRLFQALKKSNQHELEDFSYVRINSDDDNGFHIEVEMRGRKLKRDLRACEGDAINCKHDDSVVVMNAMYHVLGMMNDANVWSRVHQLAVLLLAGKPQESDRELKYQLDPGLIMQVMRL